ncbi:ATP-binding protein [Thalassotalea profundi]|uniref:ATP-binding protein n=1 Tax=Thalassotalea profundi TaxID=2036687 RepID=A0ABQ3IDB2_9GAMM|nr:ATP-binding protein [Thalassotalea profundi]GHE80162.1 hypothetical protein GCM10011501_04990 [Thalassotalea profundi]
MQEGFYGLIRIMLIDSFLPKRTYEINLAGNTNITGDNGLGKTSLIKLPVIFYGANPADVNIKENKETNYKGFSGRYLPRDGSYVIFEYATKHEKKCVVFLPDANSEEGICRYFIDSPYKHDLFFDNTGDSPRSRGAFLQQLELKGIEKYRPKSFTEYRTILLDGTQTKQLQFSMVPRGARLSKLHSLFIGMLNRSADFSVLGRIISDWAHSDIPIDATEALEKFKLDKTQLRSWLNDYRSQVLFNKLVESLGFEKFQEHYEQLKESTAQLLETQHYAIKRGKQLSEEFKVKNNEFEQQHINLKNEEKAINRLFNEACTNVDTEEKENTRIASEISTLETRHKAYLSKLGDDYKTRLSQLEKYSTEKQQLESQLNSLKSASTNIQSDFDRLTSETKIAHTKLISKFEKELTDAKLENTTNIGKINSESSAKRSSLETEVQKSKDVLNEKKRQYEINSAQLNNTIKNPFINNELVDILENTEIAYEIASTAREELQDKSDAIESAYHDAKSLFNDINNEMEGVGRQLDEVVMELADVQAALNAHDDSLLVYLKNHVPDWNRTFGKVFNYKALLNRKLTPEKVNNNHDVAFGISLDVNAIPDSDAFNVEDLGEKEQILLEEQTELELNLERLDKELNSANTKLLEAKSALEEHKREKRQNKRNLTESKNNRESARKQVNKEKRQLISDAKVELEKLNDELIPQLQTEYSRLNDDYKEKLVRINNDEEAKIASINQTFKNTNKRLELETKKANENNSNRLKELKVHRDNRLNDAGVDASLVSSLEKQIDDIQKEVTTLTELKQIFEAFEQFRSGDYSNHAKFIIDKNNSDDALKLKREKKADLYKALSEKRREIDYLHKELQRIKNDTESALSKYQFIVDDSSQYELSNADNISVKFDEKLTAQDIKRRYENYKDTYTTTKKLLASNLKHFRVFFNRDLVKGTPIYDYWISQDHSEDRILTTALVVISYKTDGHQDNDIKSLKHALNQLDKLNSFITYISNFANKMRFFNQQLDKHMEQVTEFDSLKSLTANLQFTLANESTYKDMKALSDKYTEYKEGERGTFTLGDSAKPELPPEWLFSSIEDFIENSNDTLNIKDLAQYIDFRITFNDKGETRDIRTAKFLKEASSNALSYLVLVVLFVGFVNMIRQSEKVTLTWAVDELLDIHANNIERLLELLSANDINIISACPGVDELVFNLFDNTYELFEESTGSIVLRDYDENSSDDDIVHLLTKLSNDSEVTL